MTYTPPALRQLVNEASDLRKRMSSKTVGEPDGIGVTRSVEFDVNTSKWLAPILELVHDDRIADVDTSEKRMVVTFTGSHLADFAHPYGLASVDAVLNEGDTPEETGGGEG